MGVSFDPPEATRAWVENQSYPFEVWTDADRTLAMWLGAATSADAAYPKRISAILDADGRVRLIYDQVSVGTHPADVLDDAQKLFTR